MYSCLLKKTKNFSINDGHACLVADIPAVHHPHIMVDFLSSILFRFTLSGILSAT